MRDQQIQRSLFQVRIGCIIPTTYTPVIEGVGDHVDPWRLSAPDKLTAAVEKQMQLLAEKWKPLMQIGYRVHASDSPIRRLGRVKIDGEYYHEIADPPVNSFTAYDCLNGAMLYFFWMAFPDSYRNRKWVEKTGHWRKNTIWLPCSERKTIEKQSLRGGVNHELKHGLLYLLHRIRKEPYTHDDVDGKEGKRELSAEEVMRRASMHIPSLSALSGYRQDWEMKRGAT